MGTQHPHSKTRVFSGHQNILQYPMIHGGQMMVLNRLHANVQTDISLSCLHTVQVSTFANQVFSNAVCKYLQIQSTLIISNNLLSRITAYLEVQIWSMFKHGNLTTGNKILWKRGEIAEEKLLLRSNFSSFPQYFHYISNPRSYITYSFC